VDLIEIPNLGLWIIMRSPT